jgi:hypothetical protein
VSIISTGHAGTNMVEAWVVIHRLRQRWNAHKVHIGRAKSIFYLFVIVPNLAMVSFLLWNLYAVVIANYFFMIMIEVYQ